MPTNAWREDMDYRAAFEAKKGSKKGKKSQKSQGKRPTSGEGPSNAASDDVSAAEHLFQEDVNRLFEKLSTDTPLRAYNDTHKKYWLQAPGEDAVAPDVTIILNAGLVAAETVCVGDLKLAAPTKNDLKQLDRYVQCIFRLDSFRRSVLAFILTPKSLHFYVFHRGLHGRIDTHAVTSHSVRMFEELLGLVAFPDVTQFHFPACRVDFPPYLNETRFLGSGACAEVYEAIQQFASSEKVAVKIFQNPASKAQELGNLLRVCKLGLAALPRVVDGQYDRHLVLAPVGQHKGLTLEGVLGILDALERVHALNIVHRDIRPANVIVAEGNAVLIDWGFATSTSAQAYSGTISTASTRVLEAVSRSASSVTVTPADDLVSLVRTAAVIWMGLRRHIPREGDACVRAGRVLDFWNSLRGPSLAQKDALRGWERAAMSSVADLKAALKQDVPRYIASDAFEESWSPSC
eukprot:Opistho-1_new@77416